MVGAGATLNGSLIADPAKKDSFGIDERVSKLTDIFINRNAK